MKFSKNFYKAIYDYNNLKNSWFRIKQKHSQGGIDKIDIDKFSKNQNHNIENIRVTLLKNIYTPEPTLMFKKRKTTGKFREIGLLTIQDKIIQQAFVNVIQPECEKIFYPFSYAYRPHKGHLKAIHQIKHLISYENDFFFICADIESFFDEIDQDILFQIFKDKISDEPEIIYLLKLWLKIGKIHNQKVIKTNKGLQQGFVISPILANLYLTEFDFLWKNKNYLRYADNFLFSGKESLKLENALAKAKKYLWEKRRLRLNFTEIEKSNIERGFTFLGVYFQKNGLRISPKKMKKARNKIYRIVNNPYLNIEQKIEKINNATYSWRYYYKDITDLKQLQIIDYWIVTALKRLDLTSKQRNPEDNLHPLTQIHSRSTLMNSIQTSQNIRQILNRILFLSTEANAIKSGKLTFPDFVIEKKKASLPLTDRSLEKKILSKQRFYKEKYALEGEVLVIRPGSSLHLKNDSLSLKSGYSTPKLISLHKIKAIQIASNRISVTTNLISACSNKNIPIFITDKFGNPVSQILPTKFSYMELMEAQMISARNETGLEMAKEMITGKIKNQRNIISYYAKYWNKKSSDFKEKYQIYKRTVSNILIKIDELKLTKFPKFGKFEEGNFSNILMGYEGTSASLYWELFRILIAPVPFEKRTHRNSKDKVNVMLNYGYGILYHRMTKLIIQYGLNPCIGYLHKSSENRPVLVFDLIEQFRPIAVDRVVIATVNLKEKILINKNGLLADESRKKTATNFLERLHDRFTYHKKDTSLMEQMEVRVKLLIKAINNKKKYKSFLWDA